MFLVIALVHNRLLGVIVRGLATMLRACCTHSDESLPINALVAPGR
jgi:hypothetical protein